jgi:hypothetical protein
LHRRGRTTNNQLVPQLHHTALLFSSKWPIDWLYLYSAQPKWTNAEEEYLVTMTLVQLEAGKGIFVYLLFFKVPKAQNVRTDDNN